MAEVIGVVDVVTADGKAEEVIAAVEVCVAKPHAEEGCISYALHRDNADPNHLVLVERWRSQADLDAHLQSAHVADLFAVAGTPGMLAAAPSLTFATSLGLGDPTKGNL
ncbi:MAG: antibiotic biosynthesis monooxygenase [Actinomycetota bacterium]|nr:antibiotic biosynthesis monooxygenase [Actinomycetota bacterium]